VETLKTRVLQVAGTFHLSKELNMFNSFDLSPKRATCRLYRRLVERRQATCRKSTVPFDLSNSTSLLQHVNTVCHRLYTLVIFATNNSNRSFRHASQVHLVLRNQLPVSLRQPRTCLFLTHLTCQFFPCRFTSLVTPSLFHSRLKTAQILLMIDSFPPLRLTPRFS